MVKEKLLEITWMSQVPLTWALFLQIPATSKGDWRERHPVMNQAPKGTLALLAPVLYFLLFLMTDFKHIEK